MNLFVLFLVLIQLWVAVATSPNTLFSQPPEITVIEEHTTNDANSNSSSNIVVLSTNEQPNYILPKSVRNLALKCHSKYPVTWTPNSMLHDQVIGAESERIVTNFSDSATYEYTMTLKLEINETSATTERMKETTFVCGQPAEVEAVEVTLGNRTLISTIEVRWDDSLEAVVVSLETPLKPLNQTSPADGITLVVTSKFGSPGSFAFAFKVEAFNAKCCIEPSVYSKEQLWIMHGGAGRCSQPIICMTKTDVLLGNAFFSKDYSSKFYCKDAILYDNSFDRIRSIMFDALRSDERVPRVVTCEGKLFGVGVPDKKWKRFHVVAPDRLSSLEYRLLNSGWKMDDTGVVEVTLNVSIQLRCQGSPHYYARGIIWEQQFANGSTKFEQGQLPNGTTDVWDLNIVELPVRLTNNPSITISCHIPPWNSTTWVTHSIQFKVKHEHPTVNKTEPRSDDPVPATTERSGTVVHPKDQVAVIYCSLPTQQTNIIMEQSYFWIMVSSILLALLSGVIGLIAGFICANYWRTFQMTSVTFSMK